LDDYLKRLDTSDVTEQGAGGSRVKNLAEKIAAIRERRTRCQEMLTELARLLYGVASSWHAGTLAELTRYVNDDRHSNR
jgi:hypothetical protein